MRKVGAAEQSVALKKKPGCFLRVFHAFLFQAAFMICSRVVSAGFV